MKHRSSTRPPTAAQRQRGAIALMTAILMPVLLGIAALVVDVGRMYIYKTEIQNAMDSCALAASTSLTGANDPNLFDVARAQGLALMDPSKVGVAARDDITVNRLHSQSDDFVLANVDVEFSVALGGPWIEATSTSYAGITPVTAQYARCTYQDSNNALLLVPLLRVFSASAPSTMNVAATAAAALRPAVTACAFPIAVCKAPGSTAATLYGRTVGERMTAVNDPGAGYGTGNYGWLDFTPPAGGASELAALMQGSGSCNIAAGATVGEAGVVASLERSWNSRFGVYAASLSPSAALPDFTGYGYPTSSNNYSDFVIRSAARNQFQGSVGGGSSKITSVQHGALGQKRRVVAAAIVDCSVWTAGSSNPTVEDFACILLLAPVRNGGSASSWTDVAANMDVEFLGLTRTAGTPCATAGLAGGAFGPPVPTLVQ